MVSKSQTVPNTAWLDEELRKQKTVVTGLRDLVDQQQVIIADQSQRISTLEDRLAKLQAQLARIPEVEESLRHARDQMGLMLSDYRQDQQKRDTEWLRNRQVEREQDLRAIQNMQADMQRIDALEQGLAVRQAEDRRLNETQLRLQQDQDELSKRLDQREDRWRALNERIEQNTVKTGQAGEAVGALEKAHQEMVARVLLIETGLNRVEQQVVDLQAMRAEMVKKQDDLFEFQRRADRERLQTMTDWGRRIEGFAHQLETWADQLRYFADQHERNRRVLREVQELAQQVSQQQDQLRQVQRIAEEQLRRELREWRAEVDRRWAQEVERRERTQEAQVEHDDVQDAKLTALDEARQVAADTLAALDDQVKQVQSGLLAEIGNARRGQMLALKRQAKAFQDLVVELRALFGEETQ